MIRPSVCLLMCAAHELRTSTRKVRQFIELNYDSYHSTLILLKAQVAKLHGFFFLSFSPEHAKVVFVDAAVVVQVQF